MPYSPPAARRAVKYRGYEMVVEDAEQIAAGPYITVGDWSFGQIMEHLARSFEASLDGMPFRLPWIVRFPLAPLFKGRLLNKTLPSGFKIPEKYKSKFAPPSNVPVEAGLESLRRACGRCETERQRAFHPVLGAIDRPEWDRFNLRHAELHMSFVVPTEEEIVEAATSDLNQATGDAQNR